MSDYKHLFWKEMKELQEEVGSTTAFEITELDKKENEFADIHMSNLFKGMLGLILNGKSRPIVKRSRTLELIAMDIEVWNKNLSDYHTHSRLYRRYADSV